MRTIGFILILIIAIAADAVTGFSSTVAQTSGPTFEQGTATCSITQNVCTVTVTFPIPFSAVPKRIDVSWGGVNFGVNHADTEEVIGNAYFESDNGTTWHNMPPGATELYGNQNHETILPNSFNIPFSNLGAIFFGTCIKGSSSSNATLRPMFGGQGGPFTELAATHGALDLHVDDGNTCLTSVLGAPYVQASSFSGFHAGIFSGANIIVEGISGGGAGDNPIFNNLGIQLINDVSHTPSICVNTVTPCDGSGLTATNTQFRIQATNAFTPIGTFIINFQWDAYL